jgi:hypothetical protein
MVVDRQLGGNSRRLPHDHGLRFHARSPVRDVAGGNADEDQPILNLLMFGHKNPVRFGRNLRIALVADEALRTDDAQDVMRVNGCLNLRIMSTTALAK